MKWPRARRVILPIRLPEFATALETGPPSAHRHVERLARIIHQVAGCDRRSAGNSRCLVSPGS